MALRSRRPKEINLNMTSMLDIVFQLIIFFILVTNFAAAELPKLEPPAPLESKARELEGVRTVMVNVVPDKDRPGFAHHALIAGEKVPLAPAGMQVVTNRLVREKELYEEIQVDLRADKSLRFDQIQPVMQAVTDAKIARINLVAKMDD